VAAVAALVALALPAAAVSAKPPLREVSEIDDSLLWIAIANEIDKRCDQISGRRFKAIGIMWELRARANELGYSDAEIRAYVESDQEKTRMRARGNAFVAANGVRDDQPETFCALGRAEMKKNSAIGVLLKAN
jgi:hypothetical protein